MATTPHVIDDPSQPAAAAAIERLLGVMARLRDPAKGCPWDREQNFASIAPYTIEEAYEVADAIASGDKPALIAHAIADKMERRHPHVFGDATIETAAAQTAAWEATKARERATAGTVEKPASVLDGVARALPALTRAEKLTKRAARHRFDWPEAAQVLDKIEEEIDELRAEIVSGAPAERLSDELGDLLFACANLARKLDLDPEATLRDANDKFERRFRRVEALLRDRGRAPGESTLEEMDALWDDVKAEERGTK